MTGIATGAPLFANTTLAATLTEQFYAWEERGRGWWLWDEPVALEPPFAPLRYQVPMLTTTDDGQRHTLVSALLTWFTGKGAARTSQQIDSSREEDFCPKPHHGQESLYTIRLLLPDDADVSKNTALSLLLNCTSSRSLLAFELIGTGRETHYQLICQESALANVLEQCRAHLPDAVLLPEPVQLREPDFSSPYPVVVDFGLSLEFFRPLNTVNSFAVDPLLGLIAALELVRPGERGILQVLFNPCANPWAGAVFDAITDGSGGSFFVDAPELLPLAQEKISQPLFAVVLRVAASAETKARSWEMVRALGGALLTFNAPTSNELIPLTNDGYDEDEHWQDLLLRQSRRSGMLLNTDELVGLVHPPTPSIRSQRLLRAEAHTKAAPERTSTRGGVVLGENVHHGQSQMVELGLAERVRHMHCIGASGTGKSTFLLNLICQDMEQGHGFALFDPHGDLIDDVMARVPAHRLDDVILFDPADNEFPIGFNILAVHSELERTLLASDLVGIFQRFSSNWGDQMTTVLANTVLAFLEHDQGGTLADVRRFLVEKDFRMEFLRGVHDESVRYYWQREFPLLTGRPHSSILTRLDAFLRSRLVRNIVCQRHNKLNFAAIMDEGKIFLARLSHGAIGEENAYLLGSLLVSKFHQIALSRQGIKEHERRPYFLYLDEFHHFVTPSMASILTGLRKYRLGLILAHQELRQLERRDPDVAHAVLANPYARVCFRVSESDARTLAEGFRSFRAEDLLNLGTGEAIVRLEQARYDFNLRTVPAPLKAASAETLGRQALERSRHQYATPRAEVEASLVLPPLQSDPESDIPSSRRRSRPTAKPVVPSAEVLEPTEVVADPPGRSAPHKKRTAAPSVDEPAQMGKGGKEHRYLQQLIKRWAEGMGYGATIEKQLKAGCSVDVLLEKDAASIACEISVSTGAEHELQNLRKCLAANFDQVIAVVQDERRVAKMRDLIASSLKPEESAKVMVLDTAGIFQHLQQQEAARASKTQTVKGYTVNVNYAAPAPPEQEAKRGVISRVVLGALSRKNNKRPLDEKT